MMNGDTPGTADRVGGAVLMMWGAALSIVSMILSLVVVIVMITGNPPPEIAAALALWFIAFTVGLVCFYRGLRRYRAFSK